jgi:hypothetical protein
MVHDDRARSSRGIQVWLPLGIGLVGVAARIWLWWITLGSNDSRTWDIHALRVLTDGLGVSYLKYQNASPRLNHPPLMLLYAAQAHLWAGQSLLAFVRLFKLLGLAGEALSMWALWRYASPRAFAVYACLPAPILVSGFHGNTDCLCAALVLVAAIAFDRKSYLLSGILWAAALNVKLMPLVLIPLLFLGAPTRKAFLQTAAGLALGLTPFVPVAWIAGKAMYTGMMLYNSIPDGWGLTALFTQMASLRGLDSVFEPLRNWWLVAGRFAVLLAVISVGLVSRLRRHMPMVEQAALGTALFLVLTPGFGVQYVVFAAPLICLVDLAAGAWWGWTSGLFIGAVYWIFLASWAPLESDLPIVWAPAVKAPGIVAWSFLAMFVWVRLRNAWQQREAVAEVAVPQSESSPA